MKSRGGQAVVNRGRDDLEENKTEVYKILEEKRKKK